MPVPVPIAVAVPVSVSPVVAVRDVIGRSGRVVVGGVSAGERVQSVCRPVRVSGTVSVLEPAGWWFRIPLTHAVS